MIAVRQRLGHQLAARARTVVDDGWIELIVVSVAAGLAGVALREYIAPDYKAEWLPPINGLKDSGIEGYLTHLPGYPGIVVAHLPLVLFAELLSLDEASTWRFLSAFAISGLALAVLAVVPLMRALEVRRGPAWIAVGLAAGSPAAYWALRIGHPEEVLATGLLLGAVVAAARERPIIAGILLGIAGGKAWPLVAAVPILALFLPNTRRTLLFCAATLATLLAIYVPSLAVNTVPVQALTNLGTAAIWNVGQVFWWFGDPIPLSNVALQTVPQPRVGAGWAGELSHPLILGLGTAIGLVWLMTRASLINGRMSLSLLRRDGRTRSLPESAHLAGAALLVMAGILYARCYLDTWNVPYYLLPGLVLGIIGEALLGRWPVMGMVAAGLMWHFHAPGDLTVRTAPDLYTAMYLSWTIPFSLAYMAMGFRALRTGPSSSQSPASESP